MIDFIKHNLMGLPVLASEQGKALDMMLLYVHALMVVLFVGWLGYFLYCLVRFRASANPKADYVGVKSHLSTYLEVAVAGVEALLLIGFAIPLWAKAVDSDKFPKRTDATQIRVTAQQFAWNSRYAGKDGLFAKQDAKLLSSENQFAIDPNDPNGKDDIVPPLNEMAVPVNKPVIVEVTSLDVIHSFKLPALRVCQDAIPGMRIPLHFTPTVEGKYLLTCAQLCGNSHYFMRGYFTVMKQDEYDKWVEAKSKSAAAGSLE